MLFGRKFCSIAISMAFHGVFVEFPRVFPRQMHQQKRKLSSARPDVTFRRPNDLGDRDKEEQKSQLTSFAFVIALIDSLPGL
jgi:hypothetical protein